jgi:hypothetical protein
MIVNDYLFPTRHFFFGDVFDCNLLYVEQIYFNLFLSKLPSFLNAFEGIIKSYILTPLTNCLDFIFLF